jgi:hypothetical protein
VVPAHTPALQVEVAFHTQPVGEEGTQVVDHHMLALHVLHMHSEELHLLISSAPIHLRVTYKVVEVDLA